MTLIDRKLMKSLLFSLSLCPSFQVRSMDQIDKSLQLERFVIERGPLERQLAAGGTAVGGSAI